MTSSLSYILLFVGRFLLYTIFFFNIKEYNLNTLLCYLCLLGMDLLSKIEGYNKGFDDGCNFWLKRSNKIYVGNDVKR